MTFTKKLTILLILLFGTSIFGSSLLQTGTGNKFVEKPLISMDISVNSFVSRWDTTLDGSSGTNQISLPLQSSGTYDFNVYWGDETSDYITVWNQPEVTHTYNIE
jgi:hypothetical protein